MLAMNDNNEEAAGASVVCAMARFRQPVHLWAWLESVKHGGFGVGTFRQGLNAPFLFLGSDTPLEPVAPTDATVPLGHRFESGRVFLRSSWEDPDAAHVSFTSGYDFHRGHNHQDENAVTLYALGEGFLVDPGYEAAGTRCHNTLTIDGAPQVIGSHGRVVAYREDEQGAFVRGQAAEAYDCSRALVGYFDRKVYFVRGPQPYLVWRDDTQVEMDQPSEVVARFITYPENRIAVVQSGLVIHGARTGARCLVRVMSPVADVALEVEDLAGKTFVSRGKIYSYSKYFRSAAAVARAVNPRLLTVAFPYRDEARLPEIALASESGDRLVCTLTFPDGRRDQLIFGQENAELLRFGAGGSPTRSQLPHARDH